MVANRTTRRLIIERVSKTTSTIEIETKQSVWWTEAVLVVAGEGEGEGEGKCGRGEEVETEKEAEQENKQMPRKKHDNGHPSPAKNDPPQPYQGKDQLGEVAVPKVNGHPHKNKNGLQDDVENFVNRNPILLLFLLPTATLRLRPLRGTPTRNTRNTRKTTRTTRDHLLNHPRNARRRAPQNVQELECGHLIQLVLSTPKKRPEHGPESMLRPQRSDTVVVGDVVEMVKVAEVAEVVEVA